MFHKSIAIRAFLPLAIVGLVVSGCSSNNSAPTPETGYDKDVDLTWRDSPLAEYWGDVNQELEKVDRVALANEADVFVAACMAEAGFKYTPIDYSDPKYGLTKSLDDKPVNNADDREWVVQHGYGWNYFDDPTTESSTDEVTDDPWANDPNALYESTLSETGQMEYRKALFGDEPSIDLSDEELGNTEYNWEDAGCQGAANHEIEGKIGIAQNELFDDLREAMEELYYLPPGNPAFAALDAEWASCMADSGFGDFKNPAEASETAMELYDELVISGALHVDPDGVARPLREDVSAILKEEIKIAVADFDCKEKVNYNNATQEILFALQEQFIQDNQVELDAYQAWVIESM